MRMFIIGSSIATLALALGCGASFPVPAQRMADAQSAERSATELGAATHPKAQLHLRLAQEQMTKAKEAISKGENEQADALLVRAKSDAEVAIALAREQGAKVGAQKADVQSNTQRTTNANQGAQQ